MTTTTVESFYNPVPELVRASNELCYGQWTKSIGWPVMLTSLKRYSNSEARGMHLVLLSGGQQPYVSAGEPMSKRTLGLFHKDNADQISAFFEEHFVSLLTPIEQELAIPFSMQSEAIRAYIHSSIIPLEWKTAAEDHFDRNIDIRFGRAKLMPMPGTN